MIEINESTLVVVVLLLLCVLFSIISIEKRLSALSRIDAKLDLLLKHAGVEYAPFQNLPAAAREALEQGRKIQAIKLYRQVTGAGLKEAKEFIEAAQSGIEGKL